MRYRMFYNNKGERIWLPLLAGAAIISAPFWFNNQKCCGNNNYYQGYPNQPYYPQYQYNYNYPTYYQPPYAYQQPYVPY